MEIKFDKTFFRYLVLDCLDYLPSVPTTVDDRPMVKTLNSIKFAVNILRSDYYSWFFRLFSQIPQLDWSEERLISHLRNLNLLDKKEEFLLLCAVVIQLAHFVVLKSGCFYYTDIAAGCISKLFDEKYREILSDTDRWMDFERYCDLTVEKKRKDYEDQPSKGKTVDDLVMGDTPWCDALGEKIIFDFWDQSEVRKLTVARRHWLINYKIYCLINGDFLPTKYIYLEFKNDYEEYLQEQLAHLFPTVGNNNFCLGSHLTINYPIEKLNEAKKFWNNVDHPGLNKENEDSFESRGQIFENTTQTKSGSFGDQHLTNFTINKELSGGKHFAIADNDQSPKKLDTPRDSSKVGNDIEDNSHFLHINVQELDDGTLRSINFQDLDDQGPKTENISGLDLEWTIPLEPNSKLVFSKTEDEDLPLNEDSFEDFREMIKEKFNEKTLLELNTECLSLVESEVSIARNEFIKSIFRFSGVFLAILGVRKAFLGVCTLKTIYYELTNVKNIFVPIMKIFTFIMVVFGSFFCFQKPKDKENATKIHTPPRSLSLQCDAAQNSSYARAKSIKVANRFAQKKLNPSSLEVQPAETNISPSSVKDEIHPEIVFEKNQSIKREDSSEDALPVKDKPEDTISRVEDESLKDEYNSIVESEKNQPIAKEYSSEDALPVVDKPEDTILPQLPEPELILNLVQSSLGDLHGIRVLKETSLAPDYLSHICTRKCFCSENYCWKKLVVCMKNTKI